MVNLTLNRNFRYHYYEAATLLCVLRQRLHISSRTAAVRYSVQEVRALLGGISPVCTTITRFAKLAYFQTKTSIICFPGLHSSTWFMKLITRVADRHSNAITQVNNNDMRTVDCGVVHLQTQICRIFLLFCRTVLASDQRSDSNRQKIDRVKLPPSDMQKVGLIFGFEIVEYLQNFGQVSK